MGEFVEEHKCRIKEDARRTIPLWVAYVMTSLVIFCAVMHLPFVPREDVT